MTPTGLLLGEDIKLLFLSRGNPSFMMTLSLSGTEWEEGDRRKGAEGPRGMEKLGNN